MGKICPICRSEAFGFKTSPTCINIKTGKKIPKHTEHDTDVNGEQACNKSCGSCWEAYISNEVERRNGGEAIPCMFCPSPLNDGDLERLSRKDTFERYETKAHASKTMECQNRCQGPNTLKQGFEREKHGRVFTCDLCSFSTCVDCDVPEHAEGQNCKTYQKRLRENLTHQTAEALTAANFRRCLNCSVLVTVKGCGYTVCSGSDMDLIAGCGFRFCSKCFVPWAGEASEYLLGRSAHEENCKYSTRPSGTYSLKRKVDKDDEANAVGGSRVRMSVERKKLKVVGKPNTGEFRQRRKAVKVEGTIKAEEV